MTLRKRIDRLEGATMQPGNMPSSILYEIVKPSASGPEIVGLTLRPLHCGDIVKLGREPGEDENAFRARFDAACAS